MLVLFSQGIQSPVHIAANITSLDSSKDSTEYINDGIEIMDHNLVLDTDTVRQRKRESTIPVGVVNNNERARSKQSWRRILLLIIAITVHNIPGNIITSVYL